MTFSLMNEAPPWLLGISAPPSGVRPFGQEIGSMTSEISFRINHPLNMTTNVSIVISDHGLYVGWQNPALRLVV